jgi:hypothetical protein
MRGMKITVDAAMRARDVSKPRAEDEALALADDAADPKPAKPAKPADPAPGGAVPGGAPKPGQGSRRRRRR